MDGHVSRSSVAEEIRHHTDEGGRITLESTGFKVRGINSSADFAGVDEVRDASAKGPPSWAPSLSTRRSWLANTFR